VRGAGIVSADSRNAHLIVLEAAARADPESPDFAALLKALRLSARRRPELLRVLREGRWRRSPDPFEYIRRRILGRGRSCDLWTQGEAVAVPSAEDGEFSDDSDFSERISAMRNHESDDCSPDHTLYDMVRPEFRAIDPATRVVSVRWDEVGRVLGLSTAEVRALRYQLDGVELAEALARETPGPGRKALLRGWRSLAARQGELRALLFGSK
jgi:hypothetical protein